MNTRLLAVIIVLTLFNLLGGAASVYATAIVFGWLPITIYIISNLALTGLCWLALQQAEATCLRGA